MSVTMGAIRAELSKVLRLDIQELPLAHYTGLRVIDSEIQVPILILPLPDIDEREISETSLFGVRLHLELGDQENPIPSTEIVTFNTHQVLIGRLQAVDDEGRQNLSFVADFLFADEFNLDSFSTFYRLWRNEANIVVAPEAVVAPSNLGVFQSSFSQQQLNKILEDLVLAKAIPMTKIEAVREDVTLLTFRDWHAYATVFSEAVTPYFYLSLRFNTASAEQAIDLAYKFHADFDFINLHVGSGDQSTQVGISLTWPLLRDLNHTSLSLLIKKWCRSVDSFVSEA